MVRRLLLLMVVGAAGCSGLIGLRDDYYDAPASLEAGAPDAGDDGPTSPSPDGPLADAPVDSTTDAPPDLDAAPYHLIEDAASWAAVSPSATSRFFSGAVSDGHYLYCVPQRATSGYSGVVLRYDLTASFTLPGSWTTFDIASVSAAAKGFSGGAFDGRYIYFAPDAAAANHGNMTRYDTTLPVSDAASWEIYDVYAAGLAAGAGELRGYDGAIFDGRYVYYAPQSSESAPSSIRTTFMGRVLRFDTQAPFSSWASWTVFDTTQLDVGALGYTGGIFDGRYLFLVPNATAVAARYDTTLPFSDTTSWSTFSLAAVHPSAAGFFGGTYDGRFLYFMPNHLVGVSQESSITVRYDTTHAFANATSWTALDLLNVEPSLGRGFVTGVFDGRYVYYSPFYGGVVLRFDPRGDFANADSGAWSRFATTSLQANAHDFGSSLWDGHYVYFVPLGPNPVFVRFDAKDPPWAAPSPIQRSTFF